MTAVPPPQSASPISAFQGTFRPIKSLSGYLEGISSCQTGTGLSDETVIGCVLQIALVGDATRWLLLLPRLTSMQDLQQRFRNEFLSSNYECCILEELRRGTQHREEAGKIRSGLATVVQ